MAYINQKEVSEQALIESALLNSVTDTEAFECY